MTIYKQFSFDSAHFLPHVPEGHKCKNLHGHTYHLTVFVAGGVKEREGWVMDYGDLKTVAGPVIDLLDHSLLNEIAGLENPTAELLSVWIWNKIKPLLPQLSRIELKETPSSGVIYEGEFKEWPPNHLQLTKAT
jgi:6-pyruvoyltetrahydropterin/6-carboxytetrahydropterin synthase